MKLAEKRQDEMKDELKSVNSRARYNSWELSEFETQMKELEHKAKNMSYLLGFLCFSHIAEYISPFILEWISSAECPFK